MGRYICKIKDFGDFINRMKKLVENAEHTQETHGTFIPELNDPDKPEVISNLKKYSHIKWYFYCDDRDGNTIRLYDSEFHDKFSKKLYVEPKNYVILRGHDLGIHDGPLKQKILDLFESTEKPPRGINTKHPEACLPYFEEKNKSSMEPKDRQNKCWRYSRKPDDKNDKKWYILAFVNEREDCSLTRFEVADRKHLETLDKKGDFQKNFADWLNPVSFPLRFSHTIDLEKARKEGLTECALCEIKKQVIELATSALLGILDG